MWLRSADDLDFTVSVASLRSEIPSLSLEAAAADHDDEQLFSSAVADVISCQPEVVAAFVLVDVIEKRKQYRRFAAIAFGARRRRFAEIAEHRRPMLTVIKYAMSET